MPATSAASKLNSTSTPLAQAEPAEGCCKPIQDSIAASSPETKKEGQTGNIANRPHKGDNALPVGHIAPVTSSSRLEERSGANVPIQLQRVLSGNVPGLLPHSGGYGEKRRLALLSPRVALVAEVHALTRAGGPLETFGLPTVVASCIDERRPDVLAGLFVVLSEADQQLLMSEVMATAPDMGLMVAALSGGRVV